MSAKLGKLRPAKIITPYAEFVELVKANIVVAARPSNYIAFSQYQQCDASRIDQWQYDEESGSLYTVKWTGSLLICDPEMPGFYLCTLEEEESE